MLSPIRDNTSRQRFELDIDGQIAFANYRRTDGVITITHTEVPRALQGRGIGSRLVRDVLEVARAQGLRVVPRCPFVAAYIDEHPEFADLLA